MFPSSRDEFTIAIICALVEEANAVEAIFDKTYDRFGEIYGKTAGDRNAYLTGRIGKHNVVVCYMPGMGKGSAAMVSSDLRFSYTRIELALVVGICGGVPKIPNGQNIFLGDIIISDSVIEYDLGKQYPDGFRRKSDLKDTLGRPSHALRAMLVGLSGDQTRIEFQSKMAMHAQKLQQVGSKWHRPTSDDILFEPSYTHKHHETSGADNCLCLSDGISDTICEGAMMADCIALGCEESKICRRRPRTDMDKVVVHIGRIASADTVMKSGTHRDKLAVAEGIIALEMEGAGVWDNFPCIIIKGVCDYADSHKDSKWQLFAAANGAAAAKTFLEYVNIDTRIVSPVVNIDKQTQWTVPFRRNPKFVGRRDQLEQLRALMSDPNGPRELAITGLGGVGKTAVAIELAYQLRDADPDCSIYWIPCTSQTSVEQAYSDIARRLRLPSQTDVKTAVKEYLSQTISGKWILIFDNADSEHMWMKDDNALQAFVPDKECGRTLFTSRNGQLAIDLADSNIVEVVEFDLEIATEFLQRSLLQQNLLNDHNTVLSLLSKLTFLPLAITQAVAFINKNQIGLSTYIEILEKQEMEMIDLLSENFQDKWRYKDVQNPVASTWWISFQQIQQSNPLAGEYLSFMSCIDPRDIPQYILPPAASENEKIKAIGLLKSYAFVTDSELAEGKLLNLHRLVYIATRNFMRKSLTLENQILRTFAQLESTILLTEAEDLLTTLAQYRATIESWISSSAESEDDEMVEESSSAITETPEPDIVDILNSKVKLYWGQIIPIPYSAKGVSQHSATNYGKT
ncbi:uncharacterized protein BHQ10_010255 [Talaromyces amestolkiae]|uniref:AAA+ ATPase domain-containing protein n=1 Tax=Talaromyces amestolkiae TaxID=1196081 RepID=A0A364LEM9_TALAM|nr:uncharacterized protein BHQ10_010255 [Talaromyces amestolkiae]RAO74243.1 hypothetical protein BHQ10_010255 [Talaromyces amestolkiae]